MFIAAAWGLDPARLAIQPLSSQTYFDTPTTDAVAGGGSVYRAIGSGRVTQAPDCVCSSNLYAVPGPKPGTNSSPTPLSSRRRIEHSSPFQPLKSPSTRTAFACGAQTLNDVPSTSSCGR